MSLIPRTPQNDWTDNEGSPEDILTQDEILDVISIYWLTNTATSSARYYWEAQHDEPPARGAIALPIAFSLFPKDIAGASRRWASTRFTHIVYWGEPQSGGHFAAFEKPQLFVQEVTQGLRRLKAAQEAGAQAPDQSGRQPA